MSEITCPVCRGTGEANIEIECPNCAGSGYDPTEDNPFAQCHTCYGDGVVEIETCPKCSGLGWIDDDNDDDDNDDEDEDEDEDDNDDEDEH